MRRVEEEGGAYVVTGENKKWKFIANLPPRLSVAFTLLIKIYKASAVAKAPQCFLFSFFFLQPLFGLSLVRVSKNMDSFPEGNPTAKFLFSSLEMTKKVSKKKKRKKEIQNCIN